ncbi:TetR/AcrR family transcriptional regulator [Tersicoccus sp. Bi-70]|uniref:TetR/AcrR family transcriptional regulator n=1 Tax=Tersicoccus sp. Bi-70 TaxID=1897634 RepID=UPI000977214E|nr:TetR family transcriptional regulator [Tersicoccus sp. Bi-70]OMH32482.1 hypothetical protein BGP79_07775 [Tersicoccus sp. Bi-70]
MRSVGGSTASGEDDLTTRARIRDAAVARFAHDGFHPTTVRAIAADAGVSPALLIHHFGSKDGLRRACDEHVLAWFVGRAREEASEEGMRRVIRSFLSDPDAERVPMDYMARAVTEGTETGTRFVATMIAETERYVVHGVADGTLRPMSDPRATAVVMAMGSLAMLLLPDQLAVALGEQSFGPAALRRLSGPLLQLYTEGFYTDDSIRRITEESLATADTGRTEVGP